MRGGPGRCLRRPVVAASGPRRCCSASVRTPVCSRCWRRASSTSVLHAGSARAALPSRTSVLDQRDRVSASAVTTAARDPAQLVREVGKRAVEQGSERGGATMVASVTAQLTSWIAANGVPAVFALMAIDALLPIGGELVMLYAGVIAAGVVRSGHPTLFGATLSHGVESYVVLSVAGALGSLLGSLVGWAIGRRGGRPLIERHGRWLHLTPAR